MEKSITDKLDNLSKAGQEIVNWAHQYYKEKIEKLNLTDYDIAGSFILDLLIWIDYHNGFSSGDVTLQTVTDRRRELIDELGNSFQSKKPSAK